jgi:hypothetical protein
MGGHTLVGMFSGFEPRVAESHLLNARLLQALRSGRCDWGGMRAVPRLCIIIYTLSFALQLRKNLSRGSWKAPNWAVLGHNSFGRLGVRFMGDVDWPVGHRHLRLAPRVTWASPPSDICRVAELRGSPHQLTLSRNWLWCCRQRIELQSPCECACYWCTKMYQ